MIDDDHRTVATDVGRTETQFAYSFSAAWTLANERASIFASLGYESRIRKIELLAERSVPIDWLTYAGGAAGFSDLSSHVDARHRNVTIDGNTYRMVLYVAALFDHNGSCAYSTYRSDNRGRYTKSSRPITRAEFDSYPFGVGR